MRGSILANALRVVAGICILSLSFWGTLIGLEYWHSAGSRPGTVATASPPPVQAVGGSINIVEASYGANCATFTPPAPSVNAFKPGNATEATAKTCNGQKICDMPISVQTWGDPVSGCGKNFVVRFRCSAAGPAKEVQIDAEAHGKMLHIDCNS